MISKGFIVLLLPFVMVLADFSATHARLLHESAYIAVYTTKAEPGNRNSHPVTLEADQLSAALSRLRARSGETGEIIDLFPDKNRREASARLMKELARIDAGQELHLVSFRHIGTLLAGRRNASAARIFVEKGRLNLIFGQIDRLYSEFRDPDRAVPPMGSRKQTAALKGRIMPAQGVTFVDGRDDWVAVDLVRAGPAAKEPDRAPEAASPEDTAETREKSIVRKLRILKNLRDKELITEQEYVEKKRQLLDDL